MYMMLMIRACYQFKIYLSVRVTLLPVDSETTKTCLKKPLLRFRNSGLY